MTHYMMFMHFMLVLLKTLSTPPKNENCSETYVSITGKLAIAVERSIITNID